MCRDTSFALYNPHRHLTSKPAIISLLYLWNGWGVGCVKEPILDGDVCPRGFLVPDSEEFNMRAILMMVLVGVLLVASACSFAQMSSPKVANQGTYIDGAKNQHIWSINEAHGMTWKSDPFVPVGGLFESRYMADPTDANLAADQAALDKIKAAGITDIILSAGKPLTDSSPSSLQKMIDYLDQNGFTYGIDINDGPKTPLTGYIISPNLYRMAGPSEEMVITRKWPNVDSAIWIVVSKFDGKIIHNGGAVVSSGTVSIRLPQPLGEADILIVYPHIAMPISSLSDLWGSYDDYRDKLLAFFKQVKLGPGLRFVRDPVVCRLSAADDLGSFLPDSPRFRVGFEAYLSTNYGHVGSLGAAWGLNDPVESFEVAARLMPMWNGSRGMPVAYDMDSIGMYSVDTGASRAWMDLTKYKHNSLQEKLAGMADVFKREIAKVPVIYTAPGYNSVYCSPFSAGGFDGLSPYGRGLGEYPVKAGAGVARMLVDECAKSMWLVAGAANASSPESPKPAYSDGRALSGSLDMLRELGCKGFYVDALQSVSSSGYSLAEQADQLKALADFKTKVASPKAVEYQPTIVSFPMYPETGARITRLLPGAWWLPTQRPGRTSHIGDAVGSYTIIGQDWSCFWSGIGPMTISFPKPRSGVPVVTFPPGEDVKKKKGGSFSVELSATPLVIQGVDFTALFPLESASAEIDKLAKLIPEADKRNVDVKAARSLLERARGMLKNQGTMVAFEMAYTSISDLLSKMGGDAWIEGETCDLQSFGGPSAYAGASNSQVLLLDTDQEPPLAPYTASFVFQTKTDASYDLWIASTPPDVASPASYTVNDTGWAPLKPVDGSELAYADGLCWYKFATVNLTPMKHVLRFKIDGRAPQGGRYKFALDAIMLTARGLRPDGVIVPF